MRVHLLKARLQKFGLDVQGGPELSNVLILALVSIPLIIALMLFAKWAYNQFDARLNAW